MAARRHVGEPHLGEASVSVSVSRSQHKSNSIYKYELKITKVRICNSQFTVVIRIRPTERHTVIGVWMMPQGTGGKRRTVWRGLLNVVSSVSVAHLTQLKGNDHYRFAVRTSIRVLHHFLFFFFFLFFAGIFNWQPKLASAGRRSKSVGVAKVR